MQEEHWSVIEDEVSMRKFLYHYYAERLGNIKRIHDILKFNEILDYEILVL